MAFVQMSALTAVPFLLAFQNGVLGIGQMRDMWRVMKDRGDATAEAERVRALLATVRVLPKGELAPAVGGAAAVAFRQGSPARARGLGGGAGVGVGAGAGTGTGAPEVEGRAGAEAPPQPQLTLTRAEANDGFDFADALEGHGTHLEDVVGTVGCRLVTLGLMGSRFVQDSVRVFKGKGQPWIQLSNGKPSSFIESADFRLLREEVQEALRKEANVFLLRRCIAVFAQGTVVYLGGLGLMHLRGRDVWAASEREEWPAPPPSLMHLLYPEEAAGGDAGGGGAGEGV